VTGTGSSPSPWAHAPAAGGCGRLSPSVATRHWPRQGWAARVGRPLRRPAEDTGGLCYLPSLQVLWWSACLSPSSGKDGTQQHRDPVTLKQPRKEKERAWQSRTTFDWNVTECYFEVILWSFNGILRSRLNSVISWKSTFLDAIKSFFQKKKNYMCIELDDKIGRHLIYSYFLLLSFSKQHPIHKFQPINETKINEACIYKLVEKCSID
jgi:hypothetical protein